MSDLEIFIVDNWGRGKFSVVDALSGAAGYAMLIDRADDADDLLFCASFALHNCD